MRIIRRTQNKGEIMEYYDYFTEKEHEDDEVSMEEFIAEAMRMDLKFRTMEEELKYLRTSRITLRNEVLTCYEYMKEQGFLEAYARYRNGEMEEELPFK